MKILVHVVFGRMCGDASARTLFLLEGVAAEEVDSVVAVYFISVVMVRLGCFVLYSAYKLMKMDVCITMMQGLGVSTFFLKIVVHWDVETHSC